MTSRVLRRGSIVADDWLPARLLNEPLALPSGRVATLTADRLRAMIGSYYKMRDLDPEGHPGPAAVAGLGLA